jgi:zinc/manganese transport system ATP-binding protein
MTPPQPHDDRLLEAVCIDDAQVQLGGRQIWSDVSLHVRPGEFVAVLGPNGVGKSTLLQVVLGLLPVTSGTVRVLGQ